jgi:hypothetical protein
VSSIQRSSSMLDVAAGHQAGNSNQLRGSVADPASGEAGGKMHLPQVVLRHKMREFEAKMNASSVLADPLDTGGVLSRLSIEDKERVMARMQDKIRAITDEIEANFTRIRREMDANGVFDEAANLQRAQAVCLVELQRRCRLDKLRDEAVNEILGVNKNASGTRKMSSAFLGLGLSIEKTSTKLMEKNLSSLLCGPEHHSLARDSNTQRRSPNGKEMQRARLIDSRRQKRATVLPKIAANARESATAPAAASSPTRETTAPATSSPGRRVKRGGKGESSEAEQLNASDTATGAADEVWTRHPHVLHAIQSLNSGKEPIKGNASSNSSARGNGELEVESDRRLSSAEEWQERSDSYRVIAERTTGELWRRTDRLRWDSTGHFSVSTVFTLPSELQKRLEAQQNRLLRGGHQDAEEREKREREASADESLALLRQRTAQEYATLQAQVIERLDKWNRQRVPSSTTAATARRKQRQPQHSSPGREGSETPLLASSTAPMEQSDTVKTPSSAGLSRPASTSELRLTHEPAINESTKPPTDRSERLDLPSLSASASLPVLEPPSPSPASLLALGARPGTRHRLSLLERRLLASQQPELAANNQDGVLGQRGSLRPSRRGFRRESRIGAPPPVADFSTFGRHSDARMAERRYSAQTWVWLASVSTNAAEQNDSNEDTSDEDGEELDDMLLEEGDEDEDGEEEGTGEGDDRLGHTQLRATRSGLSALGTSRDGSRGLSEADEEDARSMASWSSHVPQSARSAVSIATTVMSTTSKRTANAGAGPNSSSRRRRASKRRVSGSGKSGRGSGRHTTLSGDALSLHTRLEGVWKILEFPFSHRLLMVEKYAELVEDSSALERALTFWEACARAVGVRERMKAALVEFADRQEVNDVSRLDSDEVAALAAAVEEGEEDEQSGTKAVSSAHISDTQLVSALSSERYVKWVSSMEAMRSISVSNL